MMKIPRRTRSWINKKTFKKKLELKKEKIDKNKGGINKNGR